MTDAASASSPASPAAGLVAELVALLRLEQLDADRFRGASEDIGTRNVFGGQVLGQALMAACRTLPERPVHSLHAYFLLPGDKREPIDYAVERVRDGRSFGNRRVMAQQRGRIIFTMMASFQASEPGTFSHQRPMPAAPGPEGLMSEVEQRRALGDRLPAAWQGWAAADRPIEYRNVQPFELLAPAPGTAETQIWLRAIAPLPDEPALHCALLAYASDYGLLRNALRPHGLSFMQREVRGASLDHAMWFHRDFRIDDWLLYDIDSPSAQGARGLCRGALYARDGRLVASVAQEGMLRVLSKQ
jgi:acyl-CoA thioesterase-2